MLICDKCGAKVPDGAKFCAQCGDIVNDKDIVETLPENKIPEVKITFGYSSSLNYEKAVNIAKNILSYEEVGQEKEKIHSIKLPTTEVDLLTNMYDLIGSWKSSKMTIDGKTITKKNLVYGAMGCYKGCVEAHDKIKYCYGSKEWDRNIWGCQRIGLPLYMYGGGWLSYGKFNDSGVWFFDKNRIYQEIDEKVKELYMCPVLNKERVYRAIELIPDSINPKIDKNWSYDTKMIEDNGIYKKVATGVKPTMQQAYYLIAEEKKPRWEEDEDGDEEPTYCEEKTYNVDTSISNEHPATNETNKMIWSGIAIIILLWIILR